jgi:hypothetical protein
MGNGWRWPALAAVVLAGLALIGGAFAAVGTDDEPLTARAVVPGIARAELPPTPTPTPPPQPYIGDITSIYLSSAGLHGDDPIERGGTHYDYSQGREVLDDPTAPYYIMWYPSLQGYGPPAPGFGGANLVMAAHINYYRYGNAPFADLLAADVGDTLYVAMDNGDSYAYVVTAVDLYGAATIDMQDVVYPILDSHTERITLISCGGEFVPYPGGGGEYEGRVVLRAERLVP